MSGRPYVPSAALAAAGSPSAPPSRGAEGPGCEAATRVGTPISVEERGQYFEYLALRSQLTNLLHDGAWSDTGRRALASLAAQVGRLAHLSGHDVLRDRARTTLGCLARPYRGGVTSGASRSLIAARALADELRRSCPGALTIGVAVQSDRRTLPWLPATLAGVPVDLHRVPAGETLSEELQAATDAVVIELQAHDEIAMLPILRARLPARVALVGIVLGPGGAKAESLIAVGCDLVFPGDADPALLEGSLLARLGGIAAVRRQAIVDPVTGTHTRGTFWAALEQLAGLADRSGTPLAVAVVRAHPSERSKRDRNRLLARAADRIRRRLRTTDLIGRWAPDAFAIGLPDTGLQGAHIALGSVLDLLASDADDHGREATGWSIGAAELTPNLGDLVDAIRSAERRLEAASRDGGGLVLDDVVGRQRGTRVLLIEDDGLTAELICQRLGREGIDVRAFGHGLDALAAAPDLQPTLAIVDVSVPGAKGYEVLEGLRTTEGCERIPVLMMTMGDEHETSRAFRLGATDVLRKPFASSELVARVSRLIGGDP